MNVGAPGQLAPNINDRKSSLRESIKTVPDLVDLVNSAADDLGVDLDMRPSAKDDELFNNAPVQASPTTSVLSQHDILEAIKETISEKVEFVEDSWLEQTRRRLDELSEARTWLMDDFDEITEDLVVPSRERRESDKGFDPVQRLSKVSTSLSKKSKRLRNKSVDSVAEEVPRMINQQTNERRLSRILTQISTQSRRISAITQGLSDVREIPPDEIQEWLEVTQSELPAVIDSITTALEALPALEFETQVEDLEEQSEYEPKVECIQEPEAVYEHHMPRQRVYTEPLIELQDRVADLQRVLQNQSVRPASSDYEGGYSFSPLERAVPSETMGFEPPVGRTVEQESEEQVESGHETLGRVATRQATVLPSRRSTIMSQRVEGQSPFPFSSSEL